MIERFDHGAFRILQVGKLILIRQRCLLGAAAYLIERRIAADENQPGRRIARRAVLGPVLQRAQARFLKRFFSQIEIAEITQQRAHRLRARGAERRVDPGDVGHGAAPLTSTPGT